MSTLPLRLVETQQPTDRLPFERRRSPRHHISGRVTALSREPQRPSGVGRISSLQLLDLSDTGVGVLAQDEVAIDTPITVFFPPHGPERGWDAVGRVVRCVPDGQGHRLGIEFNNSSRHAAA